MLQSDYFLMFVDHTIVYEVYDPTPQDIAKYEGLTVQNFPKKLEEEDIINFLKEVGNEDLTDQTAIKLSKNNKYISASIEPLLPHAVQNMIRLIHFPETKKKFFGVPLYFRAVRVMSPVKTDPPVPKPVLPVPSPDLVVSNSNHQLNNPNVPVPNPEDPAVSKQSKSDDPVPKSVEPAPKSVNSNANLAPKSMISSSMTGLDHMTPLAEIKSRLFGNTRDESSDDDDDLELSNVRDKFLFSDDEYSTVNKKGKKKRGRKSSNENSDKKYKKKGTKAAKTK